MKLNDIIETLKANGFVESEDKEGRMVHPENTDFIVELYYDKECDEIEIGNFRNYASLPASAISSFMTESDDHGINVKILLNNDSVINLFCAFDEVKVYEGEKTKTRV